MAIRGIFASHSNLTGARKTDLASRVLMKGYGGMAPMLALSAGMPVEPVNSIDYSWIEDSDIDANAKVVGNQLATATSFPVDDVNIWVSNSILLVERTGEHLRLTGISGNTITVQRGQFATTAAPLLDGDRIQFIATAYGEGTKGAEAVTQVGETYSNHVQIFKSAWEHTNTAAAISYRTGSPMAKNMQMARTYLMNSIERAFMFNRTGLTYDAEGKQVRVSGGIRYAIEEYGGIVEAAASNGTAGRLNLTDLGNFMRRLFDRQINGFPQERIAYCGSAVLELLNQMVKDAGDYTIKEGEEVYGMKVTKLVTFNGTLNLITHPMFVRNDTWNHELWVLHPAGIKRRVLRQLEVLAFKGNTQVDARDAETGHLRTEMGFQVEGAYAMGILADIQTAGGIAALPTT